MKEVVLGAQSLHGAVPATGPGLLSLPDCQSPAVSLQRAREGSTGHATWLGGPGPISRKQPEKRTLATRVTWGGWLFLPPLSLLLCPELPAGLEHLGLGSGPTWGPPSQRRPGGRQRRACP